MKQPKKRPKTSTKPAPAVLATKKKASTTKKVAAPVKKATVAKTSTKKPAKQTSTAKSTAPKSSTAKKARVAPVVARTSPVVKSPASARPRKTTAKVVPDGAQRSAASAPEVSESSCRTPSRPTRSIAPKTTASPVEPKLTASPVEPAPAATIVEAMPTPVVTSEPVETVAGSTSEPVAERPASRPSTSPSESVTAAIPPVGEVAKPAYVDTAPLSSQVKSPRTLWSSRISLLLVAALVGGLAGHFASTNTSVKGTLTINSVTNSPGAAILPNGLSIPKLVTRVDTSVVSIDVKSGGEEDQGTGMIISSNGLVVTNNHVIAAAVQSGTITVTRTGSVKSLPATLVGTNPIDDVALIKINGASGLPPVTFGNSSKLQVGDAVVAIGNALGLAKGTPTVTSGIVSALGRTVTATSGTASETLNNMIQTDAAINPGNSGGPLLDSAGDVVGMNTAVAGTLPDGTSAQNIGFAIPVATIESLLKRLEAGESIVTHGAFIGVEISSNSAALQAEYGLSLSTGAVVVSVIAGTGAAKAGVDQGDVIVGINSLPVTNAQDVSSIISNFHPGDLIELQIVRGTTHLTIHVTLGSAPK